MPKHLRAPPSLPLLTSFRLFATDFARDAGLTGVRATIFTFLGAVTEGLSLMLLLPLVNVISKASFGNGAVDRIAVRILTMLPTASPFGRLACLLGIFAFVMAVRAWSLVNRDVLLSRLQTGFVETLRIRVVDALSRADWAAMTRLRHGRISHVLSNDIRNCGLAAQLTLQSAAGAAALVVQIGLALLLSPVVALIVLALLVVGASTLRPALRRSRQLGVELTESGFRLTDDTNQFLGGLKLAFSQNLQHGFASEFRQTVSYGAVREIAFARQRSVGQVALTSFAAAIAGLALLLGFGVFATSPAALIALLVVMARMSGPAAQIQQNLHYVAHGLPAYEEIRAMERDLAAVANRPIIARQSSSDEDVPVGNIVFDRVSFTHGDAGGQSAGVTDIDLVLHDGEIVGLTGSSGAGKTTLLDLLVGLLKPDRGSLRVGGVPLNATTMAAWRGRLSYVSQDPYLFDDTVAGNLRWARADASDAAMRRALKLADADRLIEHLPQGLDTMVGERGTRLSGGERQRIALARALIRDPVLLILDEATNAIDVESERTILSRLTALSPRPTVVIVAHREQSLAFCDRIVTIEAGRIVNIADGQRPSETR